MPSNRVYAPDLSTFAALVAAFQAQGLAFEARATGCGAFIIDVTGY